MCLQTCLSIYKCIESNYGTFEKLGYYANDIFRLNLNDYIVDSIYIDCYSIIDYSVWYASLGYVWYQTILSKIKKNFVMLELIHSDLCQLHGTPSIDYKKYIVTFDY